MSNRIYVKPRDSKPGEAPVVVRDPRSRDKLPPEGRYVPDTSHWRRRLIAGDVVEASPPPRPKKSKPAKLTPPSDA